MIKKRITAKIDLVSIHDDNLEHYPPEKIREYLQKRDISVLGELKPEHPLTVFHCLPLKVEYESERDRLLMVDQSANAAWNIFRAHVLGADNCVSDTGENLLEWTDESPPKIKHECRKNIPPKVVIEISHALCNIAEAPTINFTVPEQYWEIAAQYRLRHAISANTAEPTNASQSTT